MNNETLVDELKNGSNWLSGKNSVFKYNKAPKQAMHLIEILSEISIPDLILELREHPNWRIEGYGHWKDWTEAGGRAILHTGWEDTLKKLIVE